MFYLRIDVGLLLKLAPDVCRTASTLRA